MPHAVSPIYTHAIRILPFFQDFPFEDGAAPPADLVRQWLELVGDTFKEDPENCIAVHCVAGLGRSAYSIITVCS